MGVESNETEHLSRCFNLASSFLKLADDLQQTLHKRQISLDIAGGTLCFLLAKNLTTAEAVLKLCRAGYAKDALILVRTVFEAALWVLDTFREPDMAVEKATAFIKDEPLDRKKMLENMLALLQQQENAKRKLIEEDLVIMEGESEEVSKFQEEHNKLKQELTQRLRKAEQEILKIEEEYKVRESLRNYGKKRIERLAHDAGLLHIYYAFYWESSLYTHNRPRSSISFMAESEKGWDFFWGPDKKGINDVLMYLCHFLWYLLNEFNRFFKLEHDERISEKWQELDDIFSSALKRK